MNNPRSPPFTTTVKSALSDPTSFSATTLYVPAFFAVAFFAVMREKDPSPSTVKSALGWISLSFKNHLMLGVGIPTTLTDSITDVPAFSGLMSFREAS